MNEIVLSYPTEVSGWAQLQLSTPWFKGYLRRTLGTVMEGEIRTEFVDVGCCGHSPKIELRVETPGETRVNEDTEIHFMEREPVTVS